MKDPITVSQAAAQLGLSARHVRELCARGKLHCRRVNARLILIDRGDLQAVQYRPGRGRPRKHPVVAVPSSGKVAVD